MVVPPSRLSRLIAVLRTVAMTLGGVLAEGDVADPVPAVRRDPPHTAACRTHGSRRDRSIVRTLTQELLAEDVRMSAMLGELTQHMQVHPAQRQGAAAVPA